MNYRLNSPDVAQEMIDEEVIVVHLPSGSYYSLVGTGAAIWNPLVDGLPVDVIARRLAVGTDTAVEEVCRVVVEFVEQLRVEHLVVPMDGSQKTVDAPPPPSDGPRCVFVAPTLLKFTDMQELLLVDPIHEVEPTGWPARAREER